MLTLDTRETFRVLNDVWCELSVRMHMTRDIAERYTQIPRTSNRIFHMGKLPGFWATEDPADRFFLLPPNTGSAPLHCFG